MTEEVQAAPVIRVAQDLTAIEDMVLRLRTEAVNKANDREMPGGQAMVALGGAASTREWCDLVEFQEAHALADPDRWAWPDLEHESDRDDYAAALWTLRYWSDDWRTRHDQELGERRATLGSEANFIRWALPWAWDNEVHWDSFVDDIANVRRSMENILREGDRAIRGVPCMYDECRGVSLSRKAKPTRDEDGEKTWILSDWRCPRCHRTWDEDGYRRNVKAAAEQVKREEIGGEMWCSDDVAAQVVGRSVKTIRTWVNRGEVAVACLIAGRRAGFVRLAEVRARHERSYRRNVA